MSDERLYICFFQDLALSRDEVRAQLIEMGCTYEPIWLGDPNIEQFFDKVQIVVTAEHKVGPEEINRFKDVKMLSLAFTGHDEVVLEYFRNERPNLHIYYVPGYSTDSVAELAVTMASSLYRKLPIIQHRIRSQNWDRIPADSNDRSQPTWPGRELRGSKVGIIGTGEIGLRTAEIFHRGYGSRLVGWAHKHEREEFLNLGGVYLRNLDEVFAEADIVSLHVKLNEETMHIANEKRLALMKEGSILLNTARTKLVDLNALAAVLKSRPGMGAGLDVTYEDELTEELLSLENIILTPHIGFRTTRALRELALMALGNVRDFLFPRNPKRLMPGPRTK